VFGSVPCRRVNAGITPWLSDS